MSRRLALALVLSCSTWQLSVPWWYPGSHAPWVLALAAYVCFVVDAGTSRSGRSTAVNATGRAFSAWLCASMLLPALVLPWPYRLGAIAIGVGGALELVSLAFARRLGVAAIALGTLHLVQSLVIGLFHWLGPRLNDTALLGPACLYALRACGLDVALVEGDLVFSASDPPIALAPTPNNAGAVHLAIAAASLVTVRALCGGGLLALARCVAILVGAWFLRFVMLLAVFKDIASSSLMWSPWFSIVTMAFVVLLGTIERTPVAWDAALRAQLERWRASRARLAAAALAAVLLVVGAGFHDPGRAQGGRAGRVLIDEHHSDWEWTEQVFDTEWFGEKSTYNFYCFAEYLAKHYRLERGHQPLTPAHLSGFDTLVLKTPTKPFAAEEVDAVQAFVEAGGGLVLIGDHTNVFGTGEFLNQIARPFGLRYLYDSNYDLTTGALSFYEKPRLLPHPVTVNMPASMLFGGSCTLELSLCAEGAVVGYRVRTLPADYSQRSFFPEDRPHHNSRGGAFFQVGALRAGRGRVVAFTDSTIFSNFFIFMRGKIELATGLVEWASRASWLWWINWVAGGAGLILAAYALRAARAGGLFAVLAVAAPCAALTAAVLERIDARAYSPRVPHTPLVTIAFDGEHSDFFIPELRLGQEGDKDFDAFYVWVQRLGFVPRKPDRLEDALDSATAIVLLDPVQPFSALEVDALRAFVERGGGLLVMDDRQNVRSTAATVLSAFDIQVAWPADSSAASAGGDARVLYAGAGTVTGVTPQIAGPDGAIVLGSKDVGRGRVWVLANSRIFERANLGHVNMNPNPQQRMLSRLEFALMRCLADPTLAFPTDWLQVVEGSDGGPDPAPETGSTANGKGGEGG